MKKINCIVVDDEPLALDILSDYINKVSYLHLQATFDNPLEALQYAARKPIDLVFLDIQMPDLNGIQWLKSLAQRPEVIFTTAYDNYAVQGFELNALDYLMKPVPFERFLLAVNKAYKKFEKPKSPVLAPAPEADEKKEVDFIFIKSEYHIEKIVLNDLLYVEGMKDYLSFQLTKGRVLSLMNFRQAEALLPERSFLRVHKSYIVAIQHIKTIERNRICIADKLIPVGETYKDVFYEQLRREKRIL